MMELTESMFRDVAQKVCGTTLITYGGKQIDLGKPFRRLTMVDAIKEETGIDFDQVSSDEEAKLLRESAVSNLKTAIRRAILSICSSTHIARTR